MLANIIGTITETIAINVDLLAAACIFILVSVSIGLTIIGIISVYILEVFPSLQKRIGGDIAFWEEEFMRVMTLIGTIMITVSILTVLVYMMITDMSLGQIWRHDLILKWR